MILVYTFQSLKMLLFSFSLILLKLLNFGVFKLDDSDLFIMLIVVEFGLVSDGLAGADDVNLNVASFVLGLTEGCFEIISVVLNIG